jgi:hypothetical protein
VRSHASHISTEPDSTSSHSQVPCPRSFVGFWKHAPLGPSGSLPKRLVSIHALA